MLIKEYRIPMPMSVEEYRIAQLYMIQVGLLSLKVLKGKSHFHDGLERNSSVCQINFASFALCFVVSCISSNLHQEITGSQSKLHTHQHGYF